MNVTRVPDGEGLHECDGIRGFLMPKDCNYLFQCGRELPDNGVAVEVGSLMGLSASMILKGTIEAERSNVLLYCIDTWHGSPEHMTMPAIECNTLLATFEANMERLGLRDHVIALQMYSHEAVQLFSDLTLDMCFIDGAHDYDSVRRDVESWWPKVKIGGRFCGHDCTCRSAVEKALADWGSCVQREVNVIGSTHGMWEVWK